MDRMMEAIAGKRLAEQSEIRRLEKKYEGVDLVLKGMTRVSHERMLPLSSAQGPKTIYTRSEPITRQHPQFRNIRQTKPALIRTQSELLEAKRPLKQSPTRNTEAPDITARDLTTEQLKRTYSYNNVYDARVDRLPPMPVMEGFGRYRIATEADEQFKLQKAQENLRDLGPLIDKVGGLDLPGTDQSVVNRFRENFRRDSFLSHRSQQSTPSPALVEEKVDPITGTLISRGFGRSLSSSTTGSFRDSFQHRRKDSNLSMSSFSGEGDGSLVRVPSRQSALGLAIDSGSDSLTPIDEDKKLNTKQPRKAEKPCIFDEQGDMTSALDSDTDEEDIEISSDWVDATMDIRGTGALAKKLRQPPNPQNAPKPKEPSREPNNGAPKETKAGIDRSKTIRAQARPNVRRMVSHHKPRQSRRNVSDEKKPATKAAYAEDVAPNVISEAPGERKENPVHPNLGNTKMLDFEKILLATPAYGGDVDDADNDAASLSTESTAKPLRNRRNRSGTAIRVVSGNAAANIRKPSS